MFRKNKSTTVINNKHNMHNYLGHHNERSTDNNLSCLANVDGDNSLCQTVIMIVINYIRYYIIIINIVYIILILRK